MGSDSLWDAAETSLKSALESFIKTHPPVQKGKQNQSMGYTIKPGDGAFYGPKIDVMVSDASGKSHQTGTIQLDFQRPERFGLKYTTASGQHATPVLVHRAACGSLERFLAVLLETRGGKWPFWLNPRQAVVLPATSIDGGEEGRAVGEYAQNVARTLKMGGLESGFGDRFYHVDARLDNTDESLGKRVRDAWKDGFAFVIVVGTKEVTNGTLSVRQMKGGSHAVSNQDMAASKKEKPVTKNMSVEDLLSLWRGMERNYE